MNSYVNHCFAAEKDGVCVYYVLYVLISFSLAENAITNKGAKALSRALLVNRTLTSLK